MKKISYIIKVLVFLVALLGGLASPLKTVSAITAGDMWGQTVFGPAYWAVKGPIEAAKAWKRVLTKPKPTTTPTGTTPTGTTPTGTTPTGTTATGTSGSSGTNVPAVIGNIAWPQPRAEITDLQSLGQILLNWFFGIFGAFAVFAFMYSGFLYISSAGDESKAEQAKKNMTWAIIGVILAVLAVVIVNWVQSIFL